jgi:peptidoglycan lytic transglycosylase
MNIAKSGLLLCAATLLAACSSAPPRQVQTQPPVSVTETQTARPGGGYLAGDGPGANVPANLASIPDAVPRSEPLNSYANREYVALGKTYTPLTAPGNYKERGIASWYGRKFHGQRTSSGETYDMYAMTAAHPTLPIPSYARVTNLINGKSVVVRINDRGPFLHNRIIDLSYAAAYKLGLIVAGSGEVEVESLAMDSNAPVLAAATDPEITESSLPPDPVPATSSGSNVAAAAGNVYLQLGAFKSRQGAESFLGKMRAEFDGSGKQVSLYLKGSDDLVRVHIGPYTSEDEARAIAEKITAKLGFKPMVSVH